MIEMTPQEAALASAALNAYAEKIRKGTKVRSVSGPSLATWRAARRAYANECEALAARIGSQAQAGV